MVRRAHIIFHGRVQGVFFRASTKEAALRIGLTGWVRNLGDGSVEAVVEGEEGDIKELVRAASKDFPSARVDDVEIEWEERVGGFRTFEIRY